MKNKILTISIVFILISFCLISNVFAYSETFTYNGAEYNIYVPELTYNTLISLEEYNNPDYVFFASCGNSRLWVRFFKADLGIKVWTDGSGTFYSNSDSISDFECVFYVIKESDGSIQESYSASTNFCNSTSGDGYYISGSNHYFYTNMNIYTDSTCTDFFFKAPVTEGLTLAGIMNKAGEQATMEVGQIILTVMKVTAGLIACVIGFRAGWKYVKNGLYC